MSDDGVVYMVNMIIGVILSATMTRHRGLGAGSGTLRTWILAAWCLTGADLLFVLREQARSVVPRMLPTITVTAGYLLLLLAAQRSAGARDTRRIALTLLGAHALLLVIFEYSPAITTWRSVANGIVWGGLSLATAAVLWRTSDRLRDVMTIPALVMAGQGGFLAVRTVLSLSGALNAGSDGSQLAQWLGDLEVSLFMVALFMSVLVAYLELSRVELQAARAEVQELTSMLPLCSWCKKVRDDSGYWRRIESFLKQKQIRVTHALCESCAAEHFAEESGEVSALNTTG
jgi:hypothetical protein